MGNGEQGGRRFLPKRTLWRVLLGVGLLLLVAAFFGVRYYLNDVPDQLADDYRKKALPATEKVTDALDRTFTAYDSYLDDSTLPRSETRNADEIAEIKRRFIPLYDDTEQALEFSARAIRDARRVLKKQRKEFRGVPSAPLLGDKDPVVEAKEAVGMSKNYLVQSERFLRNFDKFVRFEEEALALRREELEGLGGEELSPDASIEAVKASLTEDLAEAQKSREGYLDIKPHPDQEKLYDVYAELSTLGVDYLEDLLEAYENLSITQLRAADDEYLDAYKPLEDQASYLIGVFATNSSLQKQSRKLGRLGDDLEKTMAGLGTGDGELIRPDRARGPAPPLPRKPGTGGEDAVDEGESRS